MIEPGVYNTVDPGGLEKLQRQHEQEIDQNKSKAKIWIKHKAVLSSFYDSFTEIDFS